ncbi:MAG: hypothetical protein JST35_07165 [Armatimonadetes bacterium]|nr:hypothetical protein [Armatimonadota bacterium]
MVLLTALIVLQDASLDSRARMAGALFLGKDGYDPSNRYKAYRSQGIKTYKGASPDQLRKWLVPVMKGYPSSSVDAIGAAYVMALYNCDTAKNLKWLADNAKVWWGKNEGQYWQESLQTAYVDVLLRRQTMNGLKWFLEMPSDGAVAEIKESELLRLFALAPKFVWNHMSSSKTERELWLDTLANGWMVPVEKNMPAYYDKRGIDMGIATLAKTDRANATKLKAEIVKRAKANG